MKKVMGSLVLAFACGATLAGCSKAEHEVSYADTHASTPRVSACTPDQLKVTEGDGDAGAGSVYFSYTFTNTGDSTCTLTGTPGVKRISEGHGEIPPAVAPRSTEHSITLKPGEHAYLAIGLTNMGSDGSPYVTEECKPVALQGLAITLDDNAAPLNVAHQGYGCLTGIDKLEVQPFSTTSPSDG